MNGLHAGMSAGPLMTAARVAAGVTSLTCHKPTSGIARSAAPRGQANARVATRRIVLRARYRYVETCKNPNDATEREADASRRLGLLGSSPHVCVRSERSWKHADLGNG
jgi:hypothetical protein